MVCGSVNLGSATDEHLQQSASSVFGCRLFGRKGVAGSAVAVV